MGSPIQDVGVLGGVWWRDTKTIRVLEHVMYKEGLKDLLCYPEREGEGKICSHLLIEKLQRQQSKTFFAEVCRVCRTGGNGHKLLEWKCKC